MRPAYSLSQVPDLNTTTAVPSVVYVLAEMQTHATLDTLVDNLAHLLDALTARRQIIARDTPLVAAITHDLDAVVIDLLRIRSTAIHDKLAATTAGQAWWSACIPWFRSHLKSTAVRSRWMELGADELLGAATGVLNLLAAHGAPAGFLSTATLDTLYAAIKDLNNILAQR